MLKNCAKDAFPAHYPPQIMGCHMVSTIPRNSIYPAATDVYSARRAFDTSAFIRLRTKNQAFECCHIHSTTLIRLGPAPEGDLETVPAILLIHTINHELIFLDEDAYTLLGKFVIFITFEQSMLNIFIYL